MRAFLLALLLTLLPTLTLAEDELREVEIPLNVMCDRFADVSANMAFMYIYMKPTKQELATYLEEVEYKKSRFLMYMHPGILFLLDALYSRADDLNKLTTFEEKMLEAGGFAIVTRKMCMQEEAVGWLRLIKPRSDEPKPEEYI